MTDDTNPLAFFRGLAVAVVISSACLLGAWWAGTVWGLMR